LNVLSALTVRLSVFGLCLMVALAAACSFDSSRLSASATGPHDAADEHTAEPDLSVPDSKGDSVVPPDAPSTTGGNDVIAAADGVAADDGPTGTGGATDGPVSTDGAGASVFLVKRKSPGTRVNSTAAWR
jgi:hypothetical protein